MARKRPRRAAPGRPRRYDSAGLALLTPRPGYPMLPSLTSPPYTTDCPWMHNTHKPRAQLKGSDDEAGSEGRPPRTLRSSCGPK